MDLLGSRRHHRLHAFRFQRATLLAIISLVSFVTLWSCWHIANVPLGSATLHLTTYPSVIEDGGDLVVFWHGTARRHERDFLAISCGPQRDVWDVLETRNVTDTDATPNSVRFSGLYMMRCDYKVVYFGYHVGSRTFETLASVVVGMRDPFVQPKQGHLALTTATDAMTISFNSASNRTPSARFGLTRDALTEIATGISSTYSATDMCSAPATTFSQRLYRNPGYMHNVLISHLEPDTEYFYQYGSDVDGWSEVYRFRSAPRVGSTATVKFIAYSDMGVGGAPTAQSTVTHVFRDVAANGFDSFLLHVGGLSCSRGDGSVWDRFMHEIAPIATRVPYMVSIGNYEYDYQSGGSHDTSGAGGTNGFHPAWGNFGSDSNGECGVPTVHRFHVPATGNSLFWYSFDYASVHVIQLSSEHAWTQGSEQFQWLERDLAAVNRTATPWIVVTTHRMMYSTKIDLDDDRRVGMHLREEMEQLLMKHRVNLVLSGHQHSYERSCAVYQGKCASDGRSAPVHIVVGTAGYDLSNSGYSPRFGAWSVTHLNEYGYLRAVVEQQSMTVQFVSTRRGIIADQVTLQPFHV
ncbi:hypothetical protein PINS_up011306 [Pythium insidiosum]|nr:hypothetical protein PINS_up011306 [Pythium insidiosum]